MKTIISLNKGSKLAFSGKHKILYKTDAPKSPKNDQHQYQKQSEMILFLIWGCFGENPTFRGFRGRTESTKRLKKADTLDPKVRLGGIVIPSGVPPTLSFKDLGLRTFGLRKLDPK